MKHKPLQIGFTLIEVMVTVAIIGILAAIVLPNYSDYVRRSAIQEGVSSLADMRVRLEQFYKTNRNYGSGVSTNPCGNDGLVLIFLSHGFRRWGWQW